MDSELLSLMLEWTELKKQLAPFNELIQKERLLRAKVVAKAFPSPKEGTQYSELESGYRLKLNYKIDRKIDKPALSNLIPAMPERGIVSDLIFKNEPDLQLKAYRQLTDEQRLFVDQALIIKPASPELELVPPKEEKVG